MHFAAAVNQEEIFCFKQIFHSSISSNTDFSINFVLKQALKA